MPRKKAPKIEALMQELINERFEKKAKEESFKDIEKYLKKRQNVRKRLAELIEQERQRAIKAVLENSVLLDSYDVREIKRIMKKTGLEYWVVDDLHLLSGDESLKDKVLLLPKLDYKVSFRINIREILSNIMSKNDKQKLITSFVEI